MCTDRDSRPSRAEKLRHDFRIAGMKAAGDIDACDKFKHGGVVADPVGAEPSPQSQFKSTLRMISYLYGGDTFTIASRGGSGMSVTKSSRLKPAHKAAR